MSKVDDLADEYGELLLLEPRDLYDPCIVGVVERCGQAPHVLYDAEACPPDVAAKDVEAWLKGDTDA